MKAKRLFSWFCVLGAIFYSFSSAFAKTTAEELAELRSRIAVLERKLVKQEAKLVNFKPNIFDRQGNYITGFYGWHNPEVYADSSDFSLDQSWSVGTQLAGNFWGKLLSEE